MNCREGKHRWANVGLYQNKGTEMHVPCLRTGCEAGLILSPEARRIDEHGFSLLGMDLEDDPQGGVTKIVCREIVTSYDLPNLYLPENAVIVDIGAHVGAVSIWLAMRLPDARIFALEPSITNYTRLLRNLAANGIANVTALRAAVTGDGRDVILRGSVKDNSGGLSILGEGNGLPAPSYSLSELCEITGNRIDLLKMDCEGAEYEIIHANPDLLTGVEFFVGEFHSNPDLIRLGNTPHGLLKLVHQYIPEENVKVGFSG